MLSPGHNNRPFLTKDHTGTGRSAPCPRVRTKVLGGMKCVIDLQILMACIFGATIPQFGDGIMLVSGWKGSQYSLKSYYHDDQAHWLRYNDVSFGSLSIIT